MRIFHLFLGAWIMICLTMVGHASESSRVRIEGRVVDQEGDPILVAEASCALPRYPGSAVKQPVDLQGRFRLEIYGTGTHVACEIVAPGYESRRVTLFVTEGNAIAERIELRKKQTLVAGRLHLATTADNRFTTIDVFLDNPTESSVETARLELRGTARLSTSCLDLRPSATIALSNVRMTSSLNRSADSTAAYTVEIHDNVTGWSEANLSSGTIEVLPCDQLRVYFGIPFASRLSAGEQLKLRLAIPREVQEPSRESTVDLRLETWGKLSLSIGLADGTAVLANK